MMTSRRQHLQILFGAVVGGSAARAEGFNFDAYTDAQKENFMMKATIISAKEIGHGITKPIRLEMKLGEVVHSSKVQTVDKELSDFFPEGGGKGIPMKDSWHYNVAAYKLDRLLKMNMVTPEVARPYQGKPSALSWWVDGVQFEEVDRIKKNIIPPDVADFDNQKAIITVFDELIINIDRNLSNLLITKSWKIALIDHSRAFNAYPGIRNKANLTRCSKSLLKEMRALTAGTLKQAVGTHLTASEMKGVLGRRDRIVEFFEQEVKAKGEQAVLFL